MKITPKNRIGAYQTLLAANTFISFGMGLFGSFWVIFLVTFDETSLQSVGASSFLVGLAAMAQQLAYSATACVAGIASDKIGREILIATSRIAIAVIIMAYAWIASLPQVFMLQVLLGIAGAVDSTTTAAFFGDITKKASRGRDAGILEGVTGFAAAFAMLMGGTIAWKFGIEVAFYVVAGCYFISSLLILFCKER